MLINLSNHSSDNWSEKQIKLAIETYGKIADIKFPNISPDAELDEIKMLSLKYLKIILDVLENRNDTNNAVHLMGEFSFVYSLLTRLKSCGIRAVASTTSRDVYVTGKGEKVSNFKFIKFRDYYRT